MILQTGFLVVFSSRRLVVVVVLLFVMGALGKISAPLRDPVQGPGGPIRQSLIEDPRPLGWASPWHLGRWGIWVWVLLKEKELPTDTVDNLMAFLEIKGSCQWGKTRRLLGKPPLTEAELIDLID